MQSQTCPILFVVKDVSIMSTDLLMRGGLYIWFGKKVASTVVNR